MRIRLLLLVLALTGCKAINSIKPKGDNPVVGPPPPRMRVPVEVTQLADSDPDEGMGKKSAGVATVSSSTEIRDYPDSLVVATVNGVPVFAGELLEPYQEKLREARDKMSEEEYSKVREMLIKRHLDATIERKLLSNAFRSTLKPEQLKSLDEHVDRSFSDDVAKQMEKMKVSSMAEYEKELQSRGMVLAHVKQAFADQQLAREYVHTKIKPKQAATRPEMLEYYREHLADYETPSRVRWQQILIRPSQCGGDAQAEAKMNEVVDELLAGTSFKDVAKKHSHGPTASEGGEWKWTRANSLADKQVDKLLFTMPVGDVSEVLRGEDSLQIIAVLEREEAGRKSFEKVQDEIKDFLQQGDVEGQVKEVLEELKSKAVIETVFEDEEKTPVATAL